MTWSTLQPSSANKERSALPASGVRVHVTGRTTDGPKMHGGYTALAIGKNLAAMLDMQKSIETICISVGDGEDVGKLHIRAREGAAFEAKKQVNGSYVVSLGYHTTKTIFAVQFEAFTIERTPFDAFSKSTIIDIPVAARAVEAEATQ